jgi:UDP-N-acetylglucosamine 2-epimerase (non-hydrolysing)
MPEEINRIVTDAISDLLFTTEESGNENLRREGVADEKIHFVGNTMIDSLMYCYDSLDRIPVHPSLAGFEGAPFFLATIHRPSNVDDPNNLSHVLEILESASQMAPVLFVTHPRTRERLKQVKVSERLIDTTAHRPATKNGFIYLLPPLAYPDFLRMMAICKAVLTDSGGIQEETTFLRVPCLTMRQNTERPVTVELGTNQLVGLESGRIRSCLQEIMAGNWKSSSIPPLWDGHAAERVVHVLTKHLDDNRNVH